MHFFKVHNISPINVCTNFEINRYKIDEFRKHAKIVCFIWRHVTQKRYVVRHDGLGIILIDIFISNILQPTESLYDFRFKRYDSNSGFNVLMTLTFDLCSIDCHT